MPKHTINIVIGEDGKIQSTIKGVAGPACKDIAKFLNNLGTLEEDKTTEDYYKKPDIGAGLQIGH
jgi:hypothetical protein